MIELPLLPTISARVATLPVGTSWQAVVLVSLELGVGRTIDPLRWAQTARAVMDEVYRLTDYDAAAETILIRAPSLDPGFAHCLGDGFIDDCATTVAWYHPILDRYIVACSIDEKRRFPDGQVLEPPVATPTPRS